MLKGKVHTLCQVVWLPPTHHQEIGILFGLLCYDMMITELLDQEFSSGLMERLNLNPYQWDQKLIAINHQYLLLRQQAH